VLSICTCVRHAVDGH